MKINGKVGADVSVESDEAKLEKSRWFDGLGKLDIPFVPRPKGKGSRIDFFVYSNFPDMALEIKEAAPYKFKNTNDVHRNAHYIGMWILREIHVHNCSEEDEKMKNLCAMVDADDERATIQKRYLRERFMQEYEKCVEGLSSEKELDKYIRGILDRIEDPAIKEWFAGDVDSIVGSERAFGRVRNKLYMREYRGKNPGIRLVDREGVGG